MDSTDRKKVNRIKILTQYALLRTGFEILNDVNTRECHLRFVKDGFFITCATAVQQETGKKKKAAALTKRSQTDYEFFSNDLYDYSYRFVSESGVSIPSFECTAVTSDFLLRMKGLKADKIAMRLEFDDNNRCSQMVFQTPGNPVLTYLNIKVLDRRTASTDQLQTWFRDKPPVFKPSYDVFQNMIQRAKQNKATDIEFMVNRRTRNFSIRCYDAQGSCLFADPMTIGEVDESYEEDAPDDTHIAKHVSLQQNGWLNHVHKLCKDSVVSIYMKDDVKSPLLIVTCIGHHGRAVHSIPDSSI